MPITSANQITSQAVSWLWPGRIPLGKLVMLDGNPDLGKSLLALDWCARLSTGRPFPDSKTPVAPANSLVLSAEDAAGDTIVPRLEHLGADLTRVFVWQPEGAENWPWRFPSQLDRLEAALKETNARLVVLDPLLAFLDERVQYGSDPSVRQALGPLMRLATQYECAMLLHRHLTKRGGGEAIYRGLGSIALVAACRFAMLVERDPREPTRCVLAVVRHSLSGPQPSLAYQIVGGDKIEDGGSRIEGRGSRKEDGGSRKEDRSEGDPPHPHPLSPRSGRRGESEAGGALRPPCGALRPPYDAGCARRGGRGECKVGGDLQSVDRAAQPTRRGDEGGCTWPTVRWLGRSPYTANELLVEAGQKFRPRDQAADFLEEFLSAGPRTFSEIRKASKKAGLGFRTVERAKKTLGIRSEREYLNGEPVTYWLLEDQKLGAGHYDNYVIDEMIRRLRTGLPSGRQSAVDEDADE
jgi:hypothetical protein